MNYNQLSTVLAVLSSVQPQSPEIVLINQLNNFYDFDHNIFLIDSSSDVDRFIDSTVQRNALPKTLYRLDTNDDDRIEVKKVLRKVESKNIFLIVVIERACLECSLNFRFQIIEFHRLQRNMKIVFFISPQFTTTDELQKLFSWCWNRGIANVFVATLIEREMYGSSVEPVLKSFTFDPFVAFRVLNVAKSGSLERFFPHQYINYQQQPLRFSEKSKVSMISQEIKKIFCKVLNASETHTSDPDDIDITATLAVYPRSEGLSMYPLMMETLVMVVPESLPFGMYSSYLRSIISLDIFGWYLAVVGVAVVLLTLIRYKIRKTVEFSKSLVDVANLLLNENADIKYQNLSYAEATLIVPLTFTGFLIVNGFLSVFQSFLTRPNMQPQIDTMDDLYKSSIKILVPPGYWKKEIFDLLNDHYYQKDWAGKLILAETSEITRHVSSHNTSIAFIVFDKMAKTLLVSQKRYSVRWYRISSEGSALMYRLFTFGVNENFPFIERANEIVHWLHNAGMYDKWEKEELFVQSKAIEMMSISQDSEIEMFLMVIIYGLIIIVFFIEILWKKFTLWMFRRQYKRKTLIV